MKEPKSPSNLWAAVKLGDLSEVKSGVGFPKKYQGQSSGDYPVYKVGDVSRAVTLRQGLLNSANHYVTTEEAGALKGVIFRAGSTVFAKIGEAVKLNRRAFVMRPGLADNNVMAVVPLLNESDRYLHYFLRTVDLSDLSRSTTVPSVRKGDIEDLITPLPPLAEQKVIADKLDTLLAQVDNTKARLERIPQILKRFRQSALAAAVSGRLTEEWRDENECHEFCPEADPQRKFRGVELPKLPASWAWLRFDQVAKIASNLVDPSDHPDAIHIAPNNIESGTGAVLGYQSIKEDGVTSPKHKFFSGQILYSKIRPYLCKVSVAKFEGLCSADMYPVVAFGSEWYLFRWMLSPQFTDWASNAESRSVLPKINQKDLNKIPVPTPSLAEQTEIVRRVDQLFAHADRIEQQVNNALTRVNKLTQSILAKAFRGELTEQWRQDHPDLISGENSAEALLERIKAERAAAAPARRTRNAKRRG
jgi:type I restriction enzyme, S subunit